MTMHSNCIAESFGDPLYCGHIKYMLDQKWLDIKAPLIGTGPFEIHLKDNNPLLAGGPYPV